MRKFVEGDELTLEEVKQAFQEAYDRNIKSQMIESVDSSNIKIGKDGYYEFESLEEYRKAFGGVPLEDVFGK